MSLANLQKDASIKDGGDSVGGFSVLESNVYPMTIDVAFLGESSGGAASLTLHLKSNEGQELRTTIYLTSNRTKGQKNTYTDKQGNEQYLPGFNLGTSLTELVLNKSIGEMDTEEKIVKLYDFLAKENIDTKVEMLTELLGKQVIAGVLSNLEDKNMKDDAGNYVPTGETRESNEIDKFFNMDGFTTAEVNVKASEPGFIHTWKTKHKGKFNDKRSKESKAGTVTAGVPTAAPTAPSTKIFG